MDKFKYILVVVDAFTWLLPTRTTSSKKAIELLKSIFNTGVYSLGQRNGVHLERVHGICRGYQSKTSESGRHRSMGSPSV